MTQTQRCNWAEKRAREAARILNHMLCFFLSGANDVRSYHPIATSRNLLSRASDQRGGSGICAAHYCEVRNTLRGAASQNIFLVTASGTLTEPEEAPARRKDRANETLRLKEPMPLPDNAVTPGRRGSDQNIENNPMHSSRRSPQPTVGTET
jgi:hypothetical protein